jgi:hypothetical protein
MVVEMEEVTAPSSLTRREELAVLLLPFFESPWEAARVLASLVSLSIFWSLTAGRAL